VRGVLKNPERVRFMRIDIERSPWKWHPTISITRPPDRLEYWPSKLDRGRLPYGRVLAYFWNRKQWYFHTRPRWLLKLEFDRNWKGVNGRIIVCGRVLWQGENWRGRYKFMERQRFYDWREIKQALFVFWSMEFLTAIAALDPHTKSPDKGNSSPRSMP